MGEHLHGSVEVTIPTDLTPAVTERLVEVLGQVEASLSEITDLVVERDGATLPPPQEWTTTAVEGLRSCTVCWFGTANYGPTTALAEQTLPAVDPDTRARVEAFTALGVTVTTHRLWLTPPATGSGLARVTIPDARSSVTEWLTHLGACWRITSDGLNGEFNGEEVIFDGDTVSVYDTDAIGSRILTAATFTRLAAASPTRRQLVAAIEDHLGT